MDTLPQETNIQNNGGVPQKGGLGSVIGIVIIILVLALGGWYFWSMKVAKTEALKAKDPASGPAIKSADLSRDLDASADANIDAEMQDVNSTLK